MSKYATAELFKYFSGLAHEEKEERLIRFPIQEMDRIAIPKDTYADEGFIRQEPGELQVRVTTPMKLSKPS